ncbi:MAG: zinc-binding dehydrogenase [Bacteroidia bacterium]|nr:zinc-binding dehydrogenase [Bacteroidia bacterium]
MKRTVHRMPKAGSLAYLSFVEETLSPPQDHEVTVEVKAVGLNFADIFAIAGLYSATPKGSFIPGLEFSGVVQAVGKNVKHFSPGDRVMGVTKFGGYASHINQDARYLVPLPEGWNFAEGAAYLVQVLTAYYSLLPLGAMEKGMTVLIHSAAGGVGILANRIAKQLGAYTIGTIGSPHKIDLLQAEGYDQYIVRGKDFAQQLKDSLGDRELNLVLECIGGKVLTAGFKQLAPMGRMVVYGSAQYGFPGDKPNYLKILRLYLSRPRLDVQNMTDKNKSVLAFNLIHLYQKVEIMHKILAEIQAMDLGKPLVGHRFPFEKLKDALSLFQKGQTVGKVVCEL